LLTQRYFTVYNLRRGSMIGSVRLLQTIVDNGQFVLWDDSARNHGSCIHHNR